MENLSIGIGMDGNGTNLPAPAPETAVVPAALLEEMEAMATPRICEVAPIELDDVLLTAVNRAFRDRGQKIERDDMQHIVDSLGQAAVRTCPNIRLGEIPLAISDGVFGEYGDYFGLNVHTFVMFMKARYSSRKRAESARAVLPPIPEKPRPTEREILEMDKKLLERAFRVWRETGSYDDYGNYMYTVAAKKLKLFSLSDERKKAYLEEGKKKAVAHFRAQSRRKPGDRGVIEAMDLTPGTAGRAMAYRQALRAALEGWFAELERNGEDIRELLGGDRAHPAKTATDRKQVLKQG